MDLEHPFGVAFGPASTRDELIHSAQKLYQRLLKLAPGFYGLPYTVLAVLSDNDDGTVDKNLKKSIETLFRADADGEIPILTFIQSCDVVYRKLRYFRASVGNASVIDKVLENIINGVYNFGLTIVVLSILNFNPWPLLVSVSTLLVSFAFAIGPTAAKAIEVSSTTLSFEAEHHCGTDIFIIARVSCSLLEQGKIPFIQITWPSPYRILCSLILSLCYLSGHLISEIVSSLQTHQANLLLVSRILGL